MSIAGWLERSRTSYGVAFAADCLVVSRWSNGGGKGGSVETRRCEMPSDLLSLSAVEPNIKAVSKLAQLTEQKLEEVGGVGHQVALVLPDLALRAFVFPSELKARPTELMARIAPRLSYPRSEARMDIWQAPAGWTLAAAVRNVVLRQYEQALEALGCKVVWVDGASLIPIPGWAGDVLERSRVSLDETSVYVQLYPGHYTLSVMRNADMLDVRTKLRDSGDEARIAEHLLRLPSLFGAKECDRILVEGQGAAGVADALAGRGLARERIQLGALDEEAHLAHLLETLLRRL